MHYRVHRWLAVHVIKHTYSFSQLEFGGNTSLRRQPVNHLVFMVMRDCKAEPSLQSLKGSLSDTVLSLNMYECFMNTKSQCACLKRYHANLSLKEG